MMLSTPTDRNDASKVRDEHSVAAPPPPVPPSPPRRSGFAGFSWTQLACGAVVTGALVWGTWITREVHTLQGHRIVAVNLAAMANDFVMTEARAGSSPEQTEVDTRQYMAALQSVLKQRAARGETILVGEAVVSASTPNITNEVREAVGKLMLANPAPRVPAHSPSPVTAPLGSATGAPNAAPSLNPFAPPAGASNGQPSQ